MSKWIIFSVSALFSYSHLTWAAPAAPSKDQGAPTVSGFLDVQMQWARGTLDLTATQTMPGPGTGFAVHQGAVMFNDEFENAELTVDLPFRQTTSSATSTNNFELGTKEAQAFVKYQYESGVNWQLGQFDSVFGIESNDTMDLVLPQHGILHHFTPNTHTGIMTGYSFLPFYVSVIVGNANSYAQQPSNQSLQFGARIGWSQEPVQVSLGALYTGTSGTYALNGGETPKYKPAVLLNLIAEAEFNNLELGVEADLAQSRIGVAQQVSGRKEHDLVMGFLGQAIYNFSEKWAAAVRFEYLKNDETNEYVQFIQQNVTTNTLSGNGGYLQKISFGVRRTMNEELVAKLGVDLMNVNIGSDSQAEGKTQGWAQATLAAVYDF